MKTAILIGLMAALVGARSVPPRNGIPAIAKAANGAVVSIIMSDKDGRPLAQGSGFLVSRDGRILTNYHVIRHGSSAVIKLPDGAFFVIDGVLAFDKARDIAVIKAHGENFRTVTLGDSGRVQVGDEVVAIGDPLSLESTVSNGIVSAIRAMEQEGGKFLQITAPISPGSSGGPLFNMAGEVVGITTSVIKAGENLNFAIPINDAKRLLLAGFSKVQDLPNEAGEVKRQTHDGDTTPSGNLSARDYYQQLYNAGGFFQSIEATSEGKPSVITAPSACYVCFDDNASAVEFFTFLAFGYDERYAKAFAKSTEIMVQENWRQSPGKVKEFTEARNTCEVIQKRAPYVSFMDEDFLRAVQDELHINYLRQGGRVLWKNLYSRGVKYESLTYNWSEDSWVASSKGITEKLSIEPTTLRYTEIDTLEGLLIPVVSHGACEKIADKR
jgi:hypothetical protein